jgi:hypothetical protein
MKALFWTGVVIAVIGAGLLFMLVVPQIQADGAPGLNGLPQVHLSLWAVLGASFGLAIGSVLIGIGVGRWQHPRHSHTLELGQTRHGSEV